MRKSTALILLLICMAAFYQVTLGQARPRRVLQNPTPTPQPEQTDDVVPASPSRPPVLGGPTRDPNQQKPAPAAQKTGPEEVDAGDIIRVNTTLVSIPVSVMDRDGKYIPNLRKEDFRVWEDGIEQQVAYFGSVDRPFTVALIIDTSGSTKDRLFEIQRAAQTFVDQLRTDDRVMVVAFDDKIRILCQPTGDRNIIRGAIQQVSPGSGTRLYDAVDTVMRQHLKNVEGRKAIVLFTDGVDTSSKHASYESTVLQAEEFDALIYPVEYNTYEDLGGGSPQGGRRGRGGYPGGGGGNPNGGSSGSVLGDILGSILGGGRSSGGYPGGRGGGGGWPGSRRGGRNGGLEDYELADRYLKDLARVTGARLYNADNANLDSAFQMVAEELRRQYSLGYYPQKPPQPGERRSIKVRVNRPELAVRTRDSYVFGQGVGPTTAQQQNPQQQKPPVLKKELVGGY